MEMAKCSVCETRTVDHWIRGFTVRLLLGMLIVLIFHTWKYDRFVEKRFTSIEQRNSELKQGYILPKQEKKGGGM